MDKKHLIIVVIAAVCVIAVPLLFFLCKDEHKAVVPADPYMTFLEEKGSQAKQYVAGTNLNQDYCLLVDYALPSGSPRVFLWSFAENKVIFKAHTMHGPGGGSTDEHAVLSNVSGSNCSALGHFAVTKEHGTLNRYGFFLKGLDSSNQNARERALMLHDAYWVDMYVEQGAEYIPLSGIICSGCVTVSTEEMDYLYPLIQQQPDLMLLWTFESSSSQQH